jgi:hypothetical protein
VRSLSNDGTSAASLVFFVFLQYFVRPSDPIRRVLFRKHTFVAIIVGEQRMQHMSHTRQETCRSLKVAEVDCKDAGDGD